MTLPVTPGSSLSFSQVNTELQLSSTTLITLNQSSVRTLAGQTTAGSQISFSQLSGKAYTVPGNSGVLTSGSSYTLPSTSGLTINVLVIAGGGGGGGGTSRNSSQSGYDTGGGGGGSGGNAYATNISVTPGQTIYIVVGGAGSAGTANAGNYGGGSNGGAGSSTYVTVNSTTVASATAGGGGALSGNYNSPAGGAAGGVVVGTQAIATAAGSNAPYNTRQGGPGGRGYNISTTVGNSLSSIITAGTNGYTSTGGSSGPSTTGVTYGVGGGGGGSSQSDETPQGAWIAAAGSLGAVFVWWGY